MDRTKQRMIASKGGRMAHEKGTAHEWTPEEAREAGRKGGRANRRRDAEETPAVEGAKPSEGVKPAEYAPPYRDDENHF